MSPLPLHQYCLPQIHKKGYPLRPIVAFNSAPSEKLGKRLVHIFKDLTNIKPTTDKTIRKLEDIHFSKAYILIPSSDSFHHLQYKMSILTYYIDWLLHIPMDESISRENLQL